jgi:nitroreductase
MHVHDALTTRRTVHAWAPGALPEDVLQRALEAAHQAPCHKLTWPWRFTVAGPQARAALVARGLALKDPEGTLSEAQRAAVRANLEAPAALLVVTQVVAADPHRAREDYAAVATAVQNLQLSLWADGYGAKWGTGALTRDPVARAALQLPEGEDVVAFLWVGRPARVTPQPRPPLESFVRRTA